MGDIKEFFTLLDECILEQMIKPGEKEREREGEGGI